jgi:hypothetical protein
MIAWVALMEVMQNHWPRSTLFKLAEKIDWRRDGSERPPIIARPTIASTNLLDFHFNTEYSSPTAQESSIYQDGG